MKRRPLERCTVAAVALVMSFAMVGCTNNSTGHFASANHSSDTSSADHAGADLKGRLSANCRRVEVRNADNAPLRYPNTVKRNCSWAARADYYTQAGNIVVTMELRDSGESDSPGYVKLRAIDADSGSQRWESERIALGKPNPRSEKPFKRPAFPDKLTNQAPQLPLLHKGKKTYVALLTTYVRPATAVDSEESLNEARFYDVSGSGAEKPVTYRSSESGYTLYSNTSGNIGERVMYQKADDDKRFLIVDPSTGKSESFTHDAQYSTTILRVESVLCATESGDVAVSYGDESGNGGTRFGLYHADGNKAWTGADHAPTDADPASNEFVGIIGDSIISTWRVGARTDDSASYQRPYLLAANDAATGKVTTTSAPIPVSEDISGSVASKLIDNQLLYSPDGRYAVAGPVVIDVVEHKEVPQLPGALHVQAISTNSIAYGIGNEGRRTAYNIATQKLLFDEGDVFTQVPVIVTRETALFALSGYGSPDHGNAPSGDHGLLVAHPLSALAPGII